MIKKVLFQLKLVKFQSLVSYWASEKFLCSTKRFRENVMLANKKTWVLRKSRYALNLQQLYDPALNYHIRFEISNSMINIVGVTVKSKKDIFYLLEQWEMLHLV